MLSSYRIGTLFWAFMSPMLLSSEITQVNVEFVETINIALV